MVVQADGIVRDQSPPGTYSFRVSQEVVRRLQIALGRPEWRQLRWEYGAYHADNYQYRIAGGGKIVTFYSNGQSFHPALDDVYEQISPLLRFYECYRPTGQARMPDGFVIC